MSLHPTLSEECIQYSVKRYFKAGLEAVNLVPVYFSYIYMTPKDSTFGINHPRWVKFHFDGLYDADGLALLKLNAYMFSRGVTDQTSAGKLLAQTRDLVMEYLVNVDPDGNGIRSIPLLDLEDHRHSSMVVTFGPPTDEEVADDKTLYRLIPIWLKFATI